MILLASKAFIRPLALLLELRMRIHFWLYILFVYCVPNSFICFVVQLCWFKEHIFLFLHGTESIPCQYLTRVIMEHHNLKMSQRRSVNGSTINHSSKQHVGNKKIPFCKPNFGNKKDSLLQPDYFTLMHFFPSQSRIFSLQNNRVFTVLSVYIIYRGW